MIPQYITRCHAFFTQSACALLTPLLGTALAFGQDKLEGRIIDAASKQSIPFVHIVVGAERPFGGVSNIDGLYRIVLPAALPPSTRVRISSIGYAPVELSAAELLHNGNIVLHATLAELKEVVIKAKEDPGYEIIRRAAANRRRNNPESLEGFKFTSYNKAALDVERNPEVQTELDSTGFANARFFMLESATDVIYKSPGKWNETVQATRISGVRNPAFAIISNSFQPFSTYTDHINLLETDFLNPISPGSENRYIFQLTDSAEVEGQKVYIVQFQPRAKVTGNYLKGVVSIGADDYAIVNIRAANANRFNLMDFEIRQNYSRVAERWFPKESKTQYTMYMDGAVNEDGEMMKLPIYLYSATYLQNIDIDFRPRGKDFNIAQVSIAPEAGSKGYAEWEALRPFALDTAESNTYAVFDTLPGNALNVINWFMEQSVALAAGRVRMGKVDLLLNHLMRFNRYEGFRLGAGISTNESLIKWMSLEGYFAYGFRDMRSKYGGAAIFHLSRRHAFDVALRYSKDVSEPGRDVFGRDFSYTRQGFALRNFFAEVMNPVEQYSAALSLRPVRAIKLDGGLMYEERRIWGTEVLGEVIFPEREVRLLQWSAAVQWVPGESLMQLGNSFIPNAINYPRFRFSVSGGIPDVRESSQDFVRADFDFSHQMRLRRAGRLQVHGGVGRIWGSNVAFPYLNFGRGSNGWEGSFGFETPGYFQTMTLYDFLMDSYAWAGLRHNFGTIFGIEGKYSKPSLKLNYMAGIGDLSAGNLPEFPIAFRQMNKPYLEAGLVIDDIFRYKTNGGSTYNGFGIGAFMLHGHYATSRTMDNVMFVLSFTNSF